MTEQPKVSVCMITYKHGRFLEQAVESVIAQKTSFGVEIIVGDDSSPDDTAAVLERLERRHPGRIRALYNAKNIGMHANFARVYEQARGEYVCILEGDDYWSSPDKLQRQADLLDANRDIALCCTRTEAFDDQAGETVYVIPPEAYRKPRLAVDDLLRLNFVATCSVMFRRALLPQLPKWYAKLPIGDWPLHVLVARQGAIGYIDEPMARYRRHAGGATAQFTTERDLLTKAQTYRLLFPELPPRLRTLAKSLAADAWLDLADCRARSRMPGAADALRDYVNDVRTGRAGLKKRLPRVAWHVLFSKLGPTSARG